MGRSRGGGDRHRNSRPVLQIKHRLTTNPPTKAFVLAGGFGTRLRPLTYTRPKHLLPVANRPHIDHLLDLLVRHGISDVVLMTSYLADAFEDTISAARGRGIEVLVAHEKEPLGTAGAIKNAQDLAGNDGFLVFNGDVLTDIDLGEVIAFHGSRSAEVTIVLTPVEDPSAFGVVPADPEGRVTGFIEKPAAGTAPTNLINAGIYVFEPSVLDRIPPREVWSAERQLFPALVEEGAPVYALATEAYWLDMGTPASYLRANLDALAGRYSTPFVPAAGPAVSAIDPAATVAPDARVSSSCLGPRAMIGSGAVVESSVLLPGAVVEAGATLRRTILGQDARVAAGTEIQDLTVADGELVQ